MRLCGALLIDPKICSLLQGKRVGERVKPIRCIMRRCTKGDEKGKLDDNSPAMLPGGNESGNSAAVMMTAERFWRTDGAGEVQKDTKNVSTHFSVRSRICVMCS